MQEVTIRLRFIQECLGSAKQTGRPGQVVFCMPRDANGDRVMFLPTWWQGLMDYAAKVTNSCQGLVGKIDWDPFIDGHVQEWRRVVRKDKHQRERFALHEAFHPGSEIGVNAVIPDGMTADDLQSLLRVAGTYRGISPFRSIDIRYGTFEVLSVCPTVRKVATAASEGSHAVAHSTTGDSDRRESGRPVAVASTDH